MHSHKTYIMRGHLGIKGLQIMISNELKALWSNKQIIYSSLLSPILYFLFYSVGIQSTFGNISFFGIEVSFLSYSLIGIFTMSLFKEMYQCVYRMIVDKRWGLLSLKILTCHLYIRYIYISHYRCYHSINNSLLLICNHWRSISLL